jgi:quercetin dioxygenase-like cupin family protein
MSDSPTAQAAPLIRRVVTGHSRDGFARVLRDGAASNAKFAPTGAVSTLIWCSDQSPADIAMGDDAEDYGARITGTAPPAHGSRFAVIEFPPGSRGGMHRTDSLDYVIVLSGTINMALDDGEVTLAAGDVLVQRGTNHSWINRSAAAARIAVVLLDAAPLGIGAPVTGGHSAR